MRPLVPEIKSYIKDTNDFLNKLGQVGELPEGSILCTIDVVGLYPHIPHSEGLEALKEALSNSEGQSESERERSLNEDVLSFAELVLKSNNFEFNGRHYLQKRGTAIGTRMAPSYANIFMDRLERCLIQNAEVKPLIWWRSNLSSRSLLLTSSSLASQSLTSEFSLVSVRSFSPRKSLSLFLLLYKSASLGSGH